MYTPTAAQYNSLNKNDTGKKHEILIWANEAKKIHSIVIHIQIVYV